MKNKDRVNIKKNKLVKPAGISNSFPAVPKSEIKKSAGDRLKDTSSSASSIPRHEVREIISMKIKENKHPVSSILKNNMRKVAKVRLKGNSHVSSSIPKHRVKKKTRLKPGKTTLSFSAVPNKSLEEVSALKSVDTSSALTVIGETKVEETSALKAADTSCAPSVIAETKVEETGTLTAADTSAAPPVIAETKSEETRTIDSREALSVDSGNEKNRSDSILSDEIQQENADDLTDTGVMVSEEPLVLDKSSSVVETGRSISLEKVKNLRKRYSDDLKILSRLFRSGIIGKEQYNLSSLKAQERLSMIDDILSKEDDLVVIRELKSRVETNVAEAFKNKFNNDSKTSKESIPELKKLYDDGLITQGDLDNKERSVPDKKVDVMIHKIDHVFDEYTADIKASIESQYRRLPGEQNLKVQKQSLSFKESMSEINTKIKSWLSFSKQKSAIKTADSTS